VDATVLSQGKLSAANGARGHGSVWPTIDLDWFGELVVSRLATDVENVPCAGLTFEVDEVNNSFGVNRRLRLNAIGGSAHQTDLRAGLCGGRNRGTKEHERDQAKNSCSSHSGNCDFIEAWNRIFGHERKK
jgi:hypothetical protein